jgi:DNA sulfur modification protein DndE
MNPPIEHIRLSQQAKEQLLKLKRATGVEHWNTLCRWALCSSLAEPTVPAEARIPSDSNLEMTWKVFGGALQDILLALIKERCRRDGLGVSSQVMANQFRLHLHRGIGYLAANKSLKNISGLIALVERS